MADTADTTPTTRGNTSHWFTFGLLADVARVLENHGYGPFDGRDLVELNLHLLHMLHGAEDGDDRCFGGTVNRPEPADGEEVER